MGTDESKEFTGRISRAQFLRGAAAIGVLASAGALTVDTEPASAAAPGSRGLTYRAVGYDTDAEHGGGWSREVMRGEVRAIAERLHANAVTVFGSEVDRLAATAEAALGHGLAVLIQPRLFDRPQVEALDHLARTARMAERLRRRYDQEVILVVGCEFMLFTPGIVPGDGFFERVEFLRKGNYDMAELQRLFNTYAAKSATVARRHFGGRITYGAASDLEDVDWSRFDIVGLDYYSYHRRRADHTKELAPFRRWNKPIMIVEFGCCTFLGAAEMGGMGWNIVDWEHDPPPPVVKDGYVRSEREQAEHLANMLAVFEGEGFLGASIYQFITPDSPHSPIRRYDYDMASYGLCKVIPNDPEDPTAGYRWEPKKSFHAVAAHYRRA